MSVLVSSVQRQNGVARLRIVALAGLPGAGKTRLAAALAPTLEALVVSRDELRSRYFAHLPIERGKAKAFDAMLAMVELPRRGEPRHLVLEGMPFSRPEQVSAVENAARSVDASLEWLWLDVPVAIARKRIAGQDVHSAPDRTVETVDAVASRFVPPPRATRIDASRSFAAVFRDAVSRLL